MPSSHWGNRLATWLIISVGVLAVFWTGWWSIKLETEQRVSEYYESKNDAQNATNEIIDHCLGRPAVERLECVREAVAAEEKRDYETRDLYAQEWMAHWAFLMFIASVVGTLISFLGIFLLYAAWKAARETVAVALADQRPWLKLTVEILGSVTFDGEYVRIAVLWKVINVGRSPATFVNIAVSAAPSVHSPESRREAKKSATHFASVGLSKQNLTLFPDDPEHGILIVPVDPRNEPEIMRPLSEGGNYLPEICVYAAYRMSKNSEVMVTGVTVNLHRKRPHGMGFNIKDLPIPAGEFTLERSIFTEHAT